jgi:rod shape-determining protein MreD
MQEGDRAMGVDALLTATGKAIWASAPFCAALLLTLLAMAPIQITGLNASAPNFAIIAAFFWAIYAPQLLPPLAIFALGLTMDLLGAGPLGFWPLVLLSVYGLALGQRQFFLGRSVVGIWAGFGAFSILAAAAGWFVLSLYYGHWGNPMPAFGQALVSIAVFPLVGRAFLSLRRMLTAAPERTYS